MQNRVTLLACIVVLILLVTVTTKFANAQPVVNETSRLDRAYNGIKGAAVSGANVSSLTDKFNLGLDFLRQAQDSDFRTCSSSDECKAMADKAFASVIQESSALEEHSSEASNNQKIITYGLLAPVIAFASSLCIVCLFRVWRSYQIKKFLDTEISEKKD